MPWFKVSDQLPLHPKFVDLPPSAVGLWTLAGSWCAQQLTDGHVPARIVPRLGCTTDDALELVKAGLWEEEPSGFTFHDWADYQPSRASVVAEREANAERMREARAKRKGVRSSGAKSTDADAGEDPEPDPVDVEDGSAEGSAGARADARAPERADAVLVTPTLSLSRSLSQSQSQSQSAAAAAAAAREAAAGAPATDLDALRDHLSTAGLDASWAALTLAERDEVATLVTTHGVPRLVDLARRQHRPDDPARSARAWLGPWREARPPRTSTTTAGTAGTGTSLECPQHPGQHPIKCQECAATARAMPDGFRDAMRGRRPDAQDGQP